MFCRPWRDLINGRDDLPSAEALGYFQVIKPNSFIS